MTDKLDLIFQKQIDLQKELGALPEPWDTQYIKDMILASMDELTEILRETPWKPWKKVQFLNKQKYKEEVVDLFHFFINLCIVAEIDATELFYAYQAKNIKNHERKREDY